MLEVSENSLDKQGTPPCVSGITIDSPATIWFGDANLAKNGPNFRVASFKNRPKSAKFGDFDFARMWGKIAPVTRRLIQTAKEAHPKANQAQL